jgi:molybdopterin converting factor small subunit
MARVTVVLPKMLAQAHGAGRVSVEAPTLGAALEAMFAEAPALRFHLCEESGRFRTHVLCFLNSTNSRELASLDVPLKDRDEITFVQAISGG